MMQNIVHQPKFLIVQIVTDQTSQLPADILETKQLIVTYGGRVAGQLVQRRDHPDLSFFIGAGKVEELKQICADRQIDVVVLNALAKSGQIFRLEKALWEISPRIMVWDRIDLILNIFDQHATTVEAKLQIKLARAKHMGPRIYGLGKTELSRQGGGIGTRGKGETNIEFERRKIKVDQQKIQKELKKLLQQKHARLKNRKELGIGPVALVGYTSAGKTTIFNALTGKEKEMNKGLFTTLDTVVGKLKSPRLDQPILISDTIGFITNLPPVLIDSFKTTLLESLEAKLLLHVVDASDPMVMQKIRVVDEILDQLHAHQPRLLVLNKIDLIEVKDLELLEKEIKKYWRANKPLQKIYKLITISVVSGENFELLKEKISQFFE